MEAEHRGRLSFMGGTTLVVNALACRIGLLESILLLKIDELVETARQHETIQSRGPDGRYWVKASILDLVCEWGGLFKPSTVARALKSLESLGYIATVPANPRNPRSKARLLTVDYDACAGLYINWENPAYREDREIAF